MKTIYIMRGYAGAGKSTHAGKISSETGAVVCSSDAFFMKNGKYVFDVKKLGTNHFKCYNKFVEALCLRKDVVIDNTNLKLADIKLYLDMIDRLRAELSEEYQVKIITVQHNTVEEAILARKDQPDDKNVPEERIRQMYTELQTIDISSLVTTYPNLNIEFRSIS